LGKGTVLALSKERSALAMQ
jgi:hypothetical protein